MVHYFVDVPNPFFAQFGVSVGDMRLPVSDDFALGPLFLRESFTFFDKIENEAYVCILFLVLFS